MKIYSFITLLALLNLPLAQATDLSVGKDLVEKNCFGSCHKTQFHSGPQSNIRSLDGLRERVKMCSQAFAWQDAQIDAATAYINERFYQLQ